METQLIKGIKNIHDSISDSLNNYKKFYKKQNIDMDEYNWGREKEYSINSIIIEIQNLLTDISYLTRSHKLFIELSTYDERNNIKNQLININNYILNRNNNSIINILATIKPIIRSYNITKDKDRYIDFYNETERLRALNSSLLNEIEDVKLKLESATAIHNEIVDTQKSFNDILDKLKSRQDSLQNELNEFAKAFSDLRNLANRASENENAITRNLESTNRSKDTFDNFIKKISEREDMLQEQAEETEKYIDKLNQFSKDYEKKMNDTSKLIEEAKKALNYKNAEGISAAFETQLTHAKSKLWLFIWLIGALGFIIATIFVGIWIILGWGINNPSELSNNQMIFNLVGRLSIIPLTVTAAVFCANQYTKQKNLMEDYAYKTTIAKSIIAFSEELRDKNPEKYTEYISTVLKEIHQDPLRKREKPNDKLHINKESSAIIEKVITLLQSAINK